MNFSKSEKWNKKGARCAYSIQFFAGGAVITNPPLNQNKTEGDLVNFSCEGEVTQTYQVKFSEICQLMRTSWKCVKRDRFCEDVLRANETQGTPGNLTISWYRDNIPIRSVSSMQVNFQEKTRRKTEKKNKSTNASGNENDWSWLSIKSRFVFYKGWCNSITMFNCDSFEALIFFNF